MGRRRDSRSRSRGRKKDSRSRGRRESRGREDGREDGPRSLLVRNLAPDTTTEDVKRAFGDFGELKDVYLPKDFHTKELKGIGFVEYCDRRDAAKALREMDGETVAGKAISVEAAKYGRRSPGGMRAKGGGKGGRGDSRRRRDSRRR